MTHEVYFTSSALSSSMDFLTVTNMRRKDRWDIYTENERAGCSTHIACMTSFLLRGGKGQGGGKRQKGEETVWEEKEREETVGEETA
jgi:hypothetical protein